MLDHPKWLLFAAWCFGMIHAISNLSESGTLETISKPGGWSFSFGNTITGLIYYNYSWLGGDMVYLQWLLVVIQWTFVLLILRDIARLVRGV